MIESPCKSTPLASTQSTSSPYSSMLNSQPQYWPSVASGGQCRHVVRMNLDFFAGVYGVPEAERKEKIQWALSFSGLEGKQDQVTGSLPGGWKQRVAFGAAILHEPSVLFLDEPTSGVDPLARRAFWTMINRLADAGTATSVTTHYLEESEQCNRLGFMVAGELVAEGVRPKSRAGKKATCWKWPLDQPQKAADLRKKIRNHGGSRCLAINSMSLPMTMWRAARVYEGKAAVERHSRPADAARPRCGCT